MIDRLRGENEMMVRLVSCGVIEHRQARSNRWTNKRDKETTMKQEKKEEQ
jgi:hypothetical protein